MTSTLRAGRSRVKGEFSQADNWPQRGLRCENEISPPCVGDANEVCHPGQSRGPMAKSLAGSFQLVCFAQASAAK